MPVWTRSIALLATLAAVARAAEDGRPGVAWPALLEPEKVDWPARPTLVERFGTTWLRVQTKHCQVHFGRAQSDAARELAGVVDRAYGFYARLLETEPQLLSLYLPPSRNVHHAIAAAWGLLDRRSADATGDLQGTAVLLRPGPYSRGEMARQLMRALGWVFTRVRKGAPLPAWPEASAHWWWRRTAIDHCASQVRALVEGSDLQRKIKDRLPPVGPARLGSIIDEMNAGLRTDWDSSGPWGLALCYYVVECYGLDRFGELLRLLTDVPVKQPLPMAEAFARTLGKPLDRIENECAAFFGVAFAPGRPRRSAEALRVTGDSRPRQACDAAMRRDYPAALRIATASLAASVDAHTGAEWAYLHYVAGFALDSLGHRSAAIAHYKSALTWVAPNAELYAEVGAALARVPESLYQWSPRPSRERLTWAVADQPINLHRDEWLHPFLTRGRRHTRLIPFAEGYFDRFDVREKQRLAAQYLHALSTEQGNELWQAIEAVGQLRERRALPLLHRIVLRCGATMGYRQCWLAARALGRIGDRQSIPTLLPATQCVSADVRAAASFALHRITGRHFRTPDEWRRWWASQQQNVEPVPGSAAGTQHPTPSVERRKPKTERLR